MPGPPLRLLRLCDLIVEGAAEQPVWRTPSGAPVREHRGPPAEPTGEQSEDEETFDRAPPIGEERNRRDHGPAALSDDELRKIVKLARWQELLPRD